MRDDKYTPDTEEVRDTYAHAKWELFGNNLTTAVSDITAARSSFDRWLAERDRKNREAAWNEGFDAGERDVMEHERAGDWDRACITNPYTAAASHPEPTEGTK